MNDQSFGANREDLRNTRGVSNASNQECLVLNRSGIEKLIDPLSVISAVERSYLEQSRGEIRLLDSIYAQTTSGIFAIKSAIGSDFLVIKQASLFSGNANIGLPNLQAAVSVFSTENGTPSAILLDEGILTNHRTAAAGAIAAKYLSRQDSQSVLMIGAGGQAPYQLEYLTCVRDIKRVLVYSNNQQQLRTFVDIAQAKYPGISVEVCDKIENGLAEADIVVTCTPSTKPLFEASVVRVGTHINAIGSDRPGKQELDPQLLQNSCYVPDNAAQCAKVGELQHIKDADLQRNVVYAEIAEVIGGIRVGRSSTSDITIFDSTGLASQDYAIASFVVTQALVNTGSS